MKTDVLVIGGGPAGLAAALTASESADVVLLERERELGGILPQCIHHGFGNFIFDTMMTGPEYAQHFIEQVKDTDITVKTETTVLSMAVDRSVMVTNPHDGVHMVNAGAVILAMGCRERTRNQILIPGTRPAGVYTAGTAQRLINVDGVMPGKNVVILGSGDVGLIMARRFTLEGATVQGVYEIMPTPGGLTRNIVQCLEDYEIPLHLSQTVTSIYGRRRVEAVTVARVDKELCPIPGTEVTVPCDTLILAVGLIPENELSRQADIAIDRRTGGPMVDDHMQTAAPGIFACGNVVHVHDVVDDVTVTAQIAGNHAATFTHAKPKPAHNITLKTGRNVSYVVPHTLRYVDEDAITLYFRVVQVAERVVIMVVDDKTETVLHQEDARIVCPPEMVTISVSSSQLTGVEQAIRIDVQEKKND